MSYYHLDDLFDENGWQKQENGWWKKPLPSKSKPIEEGYENLSVGIQANNITADTVTVKDSITIQKIPVVTKNELEELEKELKNQKTFLDLQTDAFAFLMKDKIEEEVKRMEINHKRQIKKNKIRDINNFTKAINKVIFTKKKETIVLWKDGTKTIVTCQEGDEFDKEKGLALCIIKYIFGNIAEFNNIFKAFDFDSNESQIEPKTK